MGNCLSACVYVCRPHLDRSTVAPEFTLLNRQSFLLVFISGADYVDRYDVNGSQDEASQGEAHTSRPQKKRSADASQAPQPGCQLTLIPHTLSRLLHLYGQDTSRPIFIRSVLHRQTEIVPRRSWQQQQQQPPQQQATDGHSTLAGAPAQSLKKRAPARPFPPFFFSWCTCQHDFGLDSLYSLLSPRHSASVQTRQTDWQAQQWTIAAPAIRSTGIVARERERNKMSLGECIMKSLCMCECRVSCWLRE